jgi:heavy metal efflux system protein
MGKGQGYAAEEVEQQVTIPIEQAVGTVPKVVDRRSRTIFGLAVVELTFEDGTNDYLNRQLVLEALQTAELPEGVTPELGPLSTGISEFYRYVLVSDRHDDRDLREIQDWVVARRLAQVPGVAEAVTFGGRLKQYQVEIEPMALERFRISIDHVAQAIQANNRNAGGALLDSGQQSMAIRGVGQIASLTDIEDIVLGSHQGVPLFIRDVAAVSAGWAPQTGIFGLNETAGGVQGIVLMRRGENPSQVLRNIHDAVEDIRLNWLPEGVQLITIHDRSELVAQTLRTVSRTLAEGLTVVFLVLFFFLFSAKAALLTAIVMPLSLLFAFLCMRLSGISASLLSLGALDFGIIVDGTVVMVDHILYRLSLLGTGVSAVAVQKSVRESARQVARPIFFSLVIIMSAFLPLLTLERVEQRLFTPMAFTVCFALLGALLLTLTLVPVLATYIFSNGVRRRRHPLLDWLQPRYGRLVRWSVQRAGRTVGAALLIVLLAVALGASLGTEFLPQLDEGVIWIRANLPAGISLEQSARVAGEIRSLIRQSPEVKLVMSQTGRNEEGTDPFGPNRNEFLIELNPYNTWPKGKTKQDLARELGDRLRAAIPGATFNFTQPIIDTSTEIATGSSADLAIIVAGPDLAELRRLAEQILAVVRTVPGAVDVSIEQEREQSQLRILLDRQSIARYGINVSEVQDVIELAIGGRPVSVLFEGERRFDIALRFPAAAREDPAAIGNILIPVGNGARVPLSQLARIEAVDGATVIARTDNQRQMTVRTNILGRDEGGFVADAQRRLAAETVLPAGYRLMWGGKFENLERARRHMAFIIPVTLAVIFALLFITFGSLRNAGMVLASVPFAAVGGIAALALRDMNLSVSAAVGFISLFGVTVMAGVILVSEINRQRTEVGLGLEEAIVQGCVARMRAVLLMILVAMLGIVPAAMASGIGSDVQRPLATVLLGGLVSALLLILIALPALYRLAAPRN